MVLAPRYFEIIDEASVMYTEHFGVEAPIGNRSAYYHGKPNAADSSVWVNNDDSLVEEITEEYQCMKDEELAEDEFADYARTKFLRTDRRVFRPSKHPRGWMTRRMIGLVAKPNQKFWEMPPLIGDAPTMDAATYINYEIDLRPDSSYWLSLQGLNPFYREYARDWAFVVNHRIFGSYFTIEFKKHDKGLECAENQVAAAGSLSLYNRFRLKQRALESAGHGWKAKDTQKIRHYGMTMTGVFYTIWYIIPVLTPENQWNGCQMRRLSHGACTSDLSVRNLIHWLNEIHYWGLTVHAPECERDIKVCITSRSSAMRVSDIDSTSEESLNMKDLVDETKAIESAARSSD